jgi:hypothetical protein
MLHVHVCIYVLIKHAVYVLLQCAEIPNLQHCAEQQKAEQQKAHHPCDANVLQHCAEQQKAEQQKAHHPCDANVLQHCAEQQKAHHPCVQIQTTPHLKHLTQALCFVPPHLKHLD